jgi:hypothetical protein
MTYVRIAALTALLLFLWPLASPAGPTYGRMLTARPWLMLEAILGLTLALTWLLRRLAETLFLRASGRRLHATLERSPRG